MAVQLRVSIFDPERKVYTYDVVDELGQAVGLAQLRTTASKSWEMPDNFESHIYYEIKPDHRGRGYGTEVLSQLIIEAGKNGVDPLIATVNASNVASIAVIEKNHGQLLQEGQTANGKPVFKYQIKTT